MKIIAYTYEADCHCVSCAQERFSVMSTYFGALDEHSIRTDARDLEGNPIHPIFSTDELTETPYCGDCLKKI